MLRRALLGLLTLFLASIVVFAATQALPGDAARAILGRAATPDTLVALRRQLNLGQLVVQQYAHWLAGFVRGNLGQSLAAGQPVTTVIGARLGNSAVLVLLAAVISIPLSILLGATSARRRDRPFDHVTSIILLALAALPEFVVGIALSCYWGRRCSRSYRPCRLSRLETLRCSTSRNSCSR